MFNSCVHGVTTSATEKVVKRNFLNPAFSNSHHGKMHRLWFGQGPIGMKKKLDNMIVVFCFLTGLL